MTTLSHVFTGAGAQMPTGAVVVRSNESDARPAHKQQNWIYGTGRLID